MDGIVIKNKGFGDSPFTAIGWVLRARSKDELRKNLRGIYSDGKGNFCSTDGHRLHVAEIKEYAPAIPAGIWLPVIDSNDVIVLEGPKNELTFPSYQKIFPEEFDPKFSGKVRYDAHGEYHIFELYRIFNHAFNINYVNDAICCGEDMIDVKGGAGPDMHKLPAIFESQLGEIVLRAAIMPFLS